MTTRPAGNSIYSVFCGSRLRQSELFDAAITSAMVRGLTAEGVGSGRDVCDERQNHAGKPGAPHLSRPP